MSLTSALLTGQSALTVSQVGLQVTGNNMANATTPGCTRQTVALSPNGDDRISSTAYVGRGVNLDEVTRHVNEALHGRLRMATSDENAASLSYDLMVQIESIQNELTEHDLSTALAGFFNSWSELARTPSDDAARVLTIEEGVALSQQIRTMREDLETVRRQIDDDLHSQVARADALMSQIAELNESIVHAEMGVGTSSSLRDKRDALLEDLSNYLDISTVEQPDGAVDVFVGSTPVVLRDQSRGLELSLETRNDQLVASVRVKSDGSQLDVRSGRVGALLDARDAEVNKAIEDLDSVAAALIHDVNRLHSQGQSKVGFTSVT
ncbi:MAG: flagellar hook-associated protein FlgK, partial [Planctomycetota bacterium]